MIEPEEFLRCLQERQVDFFTGVPDSLIKDFLSVLEEKIDPAKHVIAANEGNAVAIAAGYHFGTAKIPLVYMQNSGLGNSVNPLISLCHPTVYAVPMLLLIGWRGQPNEKDEPQHMPMGAATLPALEAMNIPYEILNENSNPQQVIELALASVRSNSAPFAIVCSKGAFATTNALSRQQKFTLGRDAALNLILESESKSDYHICNTGFLSRAMLMHRQNYNQSDRRDFLNVGAMGHVSQVALGLALTNTALQIFCMDGDGSSIMHMGGLSTIGKLKPKNFKHVIFNNCAHESVGGQPTAGANIDIMQIALACGYESAHRCSDEESLKQLLPQFRSAPGPSLLELQIAASSAKDLPRPPHAFVERKNALMQSIADENQL